MESKVCHLEGLSPAQRGAMEFLSSHLPQSDLDSYSVSLFLAFADHALALRENAPWCAELDEEIFYHYVLFPRVNDEDLSFHRDIFRSALWERIRKLGSAAERVLEVNRWCCEMASYEMQDDRTASPLTVWRSGSGRCGEESAFLVAALRSVGIAARQVYSPRWAHCDDNHAWVEALCDGEWRFLGACEPEPVPDRGWFNTPASRALLVHSRLFGEGTHPLHGEKIGSEGCVTWYNQTPRYALTRRCCFRAERDGRRAGGAVFHIQVLNEAGFHTVATLTADERGEAKLVLGIGDFHVLCRLGGAWAESDWGGEDVTVLQLALPFCGDTEWHTADYTAPVDMPVNSVPLTAEQKKERKSVLGACAALRRERLKNASAGEIAAFLAADSDPARCKLVEALSEKDHRDAAAAILSSHFEHLPPQRDGIEEEMYFRYVACPRIELEPLTEWREPLKRALEEHGVREPEEVFALLEREIVITEANTYAALVTTPAQAWKARSCSKRSGKLLAVAMLRTLGIPARLRRLDGAVEYYIGGQWRAPERALCSTLCVHGEAAAYRLNWTLSRREAEGWQLLQPEGAGELLLPEGQYRVHTTVRMPNGNQLAAWREISLTGGERKELNLLLREYALGDMLCSRSLALMSAATVEGAQVGDICRMEGKPTLLLWCEEGGEPTEHILKELLERKDSVRAAAVTAVFLLRSRESLGNATLAEAAKELGARCLIPEDWDFDLEQTARHLTCDPDTPPLAVVCDKAGNAVYGMSGYSVGAAELLLRILDYIHTEK